MSSSGALRHRGRGRTVLVLGLALAGHACNAPPSLPEPAPATRGDQRRVPYNTPLGPTIQGLGYEGVVMPAAAGGIGWAPAAADVREFESRVAGYLAASDIQPTLSGTRIRQALSNYKRQYWGIVTGGRRALLVSFIYDSSTLAAPEEWRTTAVLLEGDDPPYPVSSGIVVSGGGDRYFRLVYDVESTRFSHLRINSPI
jgi:hypothetical protein